MGGLSAPLGCVYSRRAGAGRSRSGAGAECERDVRPGVEVWRGGGQVQDHAADRADDVRAELEQPGAQPRHLGARAQAVRAAGVLASARRRRR